MFTFKIQESAIFFDVIFTIIMQHITITVVAILKGSIVKIPIVNFTFSEYVIMCPITLVTTNVEIYMII